MNDNNTLPDSATAPVVTFCNIPLDDEEPSVPVGYDTLPEEAIEPQLVTVVDIQFKKGGKIYFFDPEQLTVEAGDEVIIDTARGPEYGFCVNGNHTITPDQVVAPLRPVVRIATDVDKRTRLEYKRREADAFLECQQKILDHNLDMKLVSAEYSFDGRKILFYFTADGRVDFRELVKDLASVFHTRIELRQIGVRDEAKMLGGLGICGRPFCCKQFLDDFQPVSIKMAKTQNLSLNPTKISGTCGRLMCCLKYEQETYESLIKTSPKNDSLVNTSDGIGTITDVNLIKQSVKVRMENDPTTFKTYNIADICVLRNGKAKKNDPPIPSDLPPLPKPEPENTIQDSITMFDETTLSNYVDTESQEPEKNPVQTNRGNRENSSQGRSARTKTDNSRTKPKTRKQEYSGEAASAGAAKENKEGKDQKRNYRRRYVRGKNYSGGHRNQN